MNKIRLIIFILFSFQLVILGQKSTKISGNVTDSNDSPLPGANIFITTLNFGAAADANGKYVFLFLQINPMVRL